MASGAAAVARTAGQGAGAGGRGGDGHSGPLGHQLGCGPRCGCSSRSGRLAACQTCGWSQPAGHWKHPDSTWALGSGQEPMRLPNICRQSRQGRWAWRQVGRGRPPSPLGLARPHRATSATYLVPATMHSDPVGKGWAQWALEILGATGHSSLAPSSWDNEERSGHQARGQVQPVRALGRGNRQASGGGGCA